MMRCPRCKSLQTRITGWYKEGIAATDNKTVRRYRKCLDCGKSFRTIEEVVGIAKDDLFINSGSVNCQNGNNTI